MAQSHTLLAESAQPDVRTPRPQTRARTFVTRLSREHLAVLDMNRLSARQPTIHALLDVDVTEARELMRGSDVGRPTMTAFVLATVARAIRDCPELNVRRAGRYVVHFDDVDVVATVERTAGGASLPIPFVVHAADEKSVEAIAAELRADRSTPLSDRRGRIAPSPLNSLPPVVRRIGTALLSRLPSAAATFGPPIGVSSVGMFGVGWGIPLSPLTLMATLGGVSSRPVFVQGHVYNHEFLPLTLSFDHVLVDGAPAARFATTLRGMLESAAAFESG